MSEIFSIFSLSEDIADVDPLFFCTLILVRAASKPFKNILAKFRETCQYLYTLYF